MTQMKQDKNFKPITETHPAIAAEWHPDNKYSPANLSYGSRRKIKWSGICGHEWEAVLNSRVMGNGCPYCSGKRILAGYNDISTTHPEFASQWHPTLNTIKITEVAVGSNKKVWWLGECGHPFQMLMPNRTKLKQGCSVCAGYQIFVGYNDMTTTHPELLKEWDYEANDLHPTEIISGSEKKIAWKCSKGHTWKANIRNRAMLGKNCPVCSNYVIVAGINDLATLNPELAAQWHPTLNKKPVTAYGAGSAFIVWWMCKKKHSWKAKIVNRHLLGRDCPHCSRRATSKSELAFRTYFSPLFQSINQNHVDKTVVGGKKYQLDIVGVFKTLNVAIEYDGAFYHANNKMIQRDLVKTQDLLDDGYKVIRIRENALVFVDIQNPNFLQVRHNFSLDPSHIARTGESIMKWLIKLAE